LCRTSPAFRSLIGTTVGIGSQGIVMDGTPEQKATWLPRLASGELIAAFALTEPEAGSDAASLRTSARRDGDCYVINGTKRYITNARQAGIFTLMARTDASTRGSRGVSAFIVDARSPGISLGKIDRKMGQRGAHTCDVIFEDCRVPAANLIGGREGQGFTTAMKTLEKGRIHIAAVCVGVAERMLADALRYSIERRQFGRPIANFQLIQAMLADSRTELYAARSMVFDAARRRDAVRRSRPKHPAASSSPPRCAGALPTVPCRSSAVRATSRTAASSASIATCGCSASTRARARSSSS
jgi:acyl-CoA dehydrogenase